MEVKIKKLKEKAIIPVYAKLGDAGLDLTAISKKIDENGNIVYGTGLSFEIPDGFVGLIFPRSSNASKDLILSNSVGVIDSGYRGEVIFKFKQSNNLAKHTYRIGDRVGQMIIIPYPKVRFIEVDKLSDTERGFNGYGSTGK